MSDVQQFLSHMVSKPWMKDENYRYAQSNFLLLKEHFRRMRIWSKHLGINFSWELDIVWKLRPELALPKTILNSIKKLSMPRIATKITLINVMRWYYLIDNGFQVNQENNLPLPYKAAELWLRRGGSYKFDKERIEVFSGTTLLRSYSRADLLTSNLHQTIISPEILVLDGIDGLIDDKSS